jgi:hypothetical protein
MTPDKPNNWLNKAKDAVKAELKGKPKKAPPAVIPVTTNQQLKGLWKQFPALATVFSIIMRRWRRSSSTRLGHKGYWAAYTQSEWAADAGVSVATWKRAVDLLVAYGLVERDHGQHGGRRYLSFLRPTALILELSGATEADLKHLEAAPYSAPTTPGPEPKALTKAGFKPVVAPLALGPMPTWQEIMSPLDEE